MDVELETLYRKAVELTTTLSFDSFGAERIAKAMQFKNSTISRIREFLRDFPSLTESQLFSVNELSTMLAEACLETASLLFSCGAPKEVWRQWSLLSGLLFKLGGEQAAAIELLAISRIVPNDDKLSTLATAPLASYREQAVQYVVFRFEGANPPPLPEPGLPPDSYYRSLIQALASNDHAALIKAITEVVSYWLNESPYGEYEPGIFPVFEPEINAVVSAMVMQGFVLEFEDQKIEEFLRASLE